MPSPSPTSSLRSRSTRGTAAPYWFALANGIAIGLSQVLAPGWASAIIATVIATGLATAVAAGIDRTRSARSSRVITYVAQATRLAAPLPEFCRAAALGETRRTGRALERLADLLASSMPVAEALAGAVPEMPPRDIELARAGEANGALPTTLARLAAVRGAARNEDFPSVDSPFIGDASRHQFPLIYIGIFLVLIPAVCVMLLVFVAPKFAMIFRDFGATPPPWMRRLERWNEAGIQVEIVMLVFAALAALLLIGLIARAFRRGIRRVRSRRPWPIGTGAWFQRDRDLADVCQTIADALVARRPADAAVAEAATLDVGRTLARRLAEWRSRLVAGQPFAAASREAGLPNLVADLAGDGSPEAADAFAFLARHYRSRADRTHDWLVSAASPAVTLVAAVPVALIAYALFESMRLLADASMPKNLGM